MACPTCGEAGEYVNATPLAECRHFFARTLWAMHRLRLALHGLGRSDRAAIVSALIREVEALTEDTSPGEDA
jgi:hypothetical protein